MIKPVFIHLASNHNIICVKTIYRVVLDYTQNIENNSYMSKHLAKNKKQCQSRYSSDGTLAV